MQMTNNGLNLNFLNFKLSLDPISQGTIGNSRQKKDFQPYKVLLGVYVKIKNKYKLLNFKCQVLI